MTQEATQPLDESFWHNLNESQELDDEDSADIFCILHPSSKLACEATAILAADNEVDEASAAEEDEPELDDREHIKAPDNGNDDSTTSFKGIKSQDIVLRLSDLDTTKDPLLGFCFGRNQNTNDFPLHDPDHRVSHEHFRIYVNEYGAIMLEDTSRNGTFLDEKALRCRLKENDHPYRHTLDNGSVIKLAMTPGTNRDYYKFVVRIPRREGVVEAMYESNLTNYFLRLNEIKLDRDKKANPSPVVLWPHAKSGTSRPQDTLDTARSSSSSVVSKRPTTLKANWKGGEKYNVVKKIGQGAFATVYKITQRKDGKAFAAKELEKRRFVKDGILDVRIVNELKIMRRIHHENIVTFVEYIDWEDCLYIVMELIPGGDLAQMIAASGELREDQVRDMTVQLLGALQYLHCRGITHRDLKPDNIMLSNHDPIRVKLTDFGLSKMVLDNDTFMKTFCGTLNYCAPEVYHEFHEYDPDGHHHPGRKSRHVEEPSYSSSCDVWSLAGVLWFSLCSRPPFQLRGPGFDYRDILHMIMTSALDIRPLQILELSEDCIDFLKSMLIKWPQNRPSIEKLKAHAWITGIPSTQTSNEEDEEVDLDSDQEATESIPTEIVRSTSRLVLDSRMEDDEVNGLDSLEEMDRNNLRLSLERSFDMPSSVNSGGSSADESYAFMKNGPESGRLFGELGSSALGSSGVIPDGRLNLPLSSYGDAHQQMVSDSDISKHGPSESQIHPLFRNANTASPQIRAELFDKSNSNSPSLMGTEFVFGQLQMGSPSAAASPQNGMAGSPEDQSVVGNVHHPGDTFVTAPSTSLRRQREDSEEQGGDEPAPKRPKIVNPDDLPIDKAYFWNTRDATTWHDDYPSITHGELRALEAKAKAEGKEFEPSRTTESPNYSSTGRSSDCNSPTPSIYHKSMSSSSRKTSALIKDNDFKEPYRILAKLVGIEGTALPSIVINITDQFTSWGRGLGNTHVYHDPKDTRIGKYSLKLILWRPGMAPDESLNVSNSSFYIATKSLNGLKVNGFQVPSYDRDNYRGESRNWVQLKSGDIISIWDHHHEPEKYIMLRFDVLGVPKETRSSEQVALMPEGKDRDELEAMVLRRELEHHKRLESKTQADEQQQLDDPSIMRTDANTQKPSGSHARQLEVQTGGSALQPLTANSNRVVVRPRSGGPIARVRQEHGVPPRIPRQSPSLASTDDQLSTTKSNASTGIGSGRPLNAALSASVNSRQVHYRDQAHAENQKQPNVKKASGGEAKIAPKSRSSRQPVRTTSRANGQDQAKYPSITPSEASTERE